MIRILLDMQCHKEPKEKKKNKNKLIPSVKFYFFIPKTYVLEFSGLAVHKASLNVMISVMDNETSFQFSAIKSRLGSYAYLLHN